MSPIIYLLQTGDISGLDYPRGSLWKIANSTFKFAPEETDELKLERCVKPDSKEEEGNVTRKYSEHEYCKLEETDFQLLLAVKLEDRLGIYNDDEWMNEGRNMKENDEIVILKLGEENNLTGKIRYIGTIYEFSPAKYFGVEFHAQGKGISDGTFRENNHFECADDGGYFSNISNIRLNKNGKNNSESSKPLDISTDVSMFQSSDSKTKHFVDTIESSESLHQVGCKEKGVKLRGPSEKSLMEMIGQICDVLCTPTEVTPINVTEFCSSKLFLKVSPEYDLFAKVIYAMFSFNKSLDSQFFMGAYKQYTSKTMLRDHLCSAIVNPLRSNTEVEEGIKTFTKIMSKMKVSFCKKNSNDATLFSDNLIQACFDSSVMALTIIEEPYKSSIQETLNEQMSSTLYLQNIHKCLIYIVSLRDAGKHRVVPSSVLNLSIVLLCCSCKTPLTCPHCGHNLKVNLGYKCSDCNKELVRERQTPYCSGCSDSYSSGSGTPITKETTPTCSRPKSPNNPDIIDKNFKQMELFAVIFKTKSDKRGAFVKTSTDENAVWLAYEDNGDIKYVPEFDTFLKNYHTSSYEDILYHMVDNLEICYYRPLTKQDLEIVQLTK